VGHIYHWDRPRKCTVCEPKVASRHCSRCGNRPRRSAQSGADFGDRGCQGFRPGHSGMARHLVDHQYRCPQGAGAEPDSRKSIISGPNPNVFMTAIRFGSWLQFPGNWIVSAVRASSVAVLPRRRRRLGSTTSGATRPQQVLELHRQWARNRSRPRWRLPAAGHATMAGSQSRALRLVSRMLHC
jgi:hypothetical protein